MQKNTRLDALCEALGYRFHDNGILTLALTHCSYCGTKGQNNQRLEFLGDAILEFVISELLYHEVNVDEGHLTRMRAKVVCEVSLAKAAREIDLSPLILLGKGEEATGGRDKPSILADMMEALLGAVFLDGGMEDARNCILHVLHETIQLSMSEGGGQDHKTNLQQLCASLQLASPVYETLLVEGPPHAPSFTVGVFVSGILQSKGMGKTKKEAEQKAAKQAAEALKQNAKMTPTP